MFLGAKIVMRSFILKYIITIFAPKSVMLFMICKRLRGLRNRVSEMEPEMCKVDGQEF